MQAVLYIAHGSRDRQSIEDVKRFIAQCAMLTDVPIQEVCFLELAAPNIAQGMARCVAQGASKIAVMPLLLMAAAHARDDIPQYIAQARQRYPQVAITYGQVLGIDKLLIASLTETIRSQHVPLGGQTAILLIGRGSSDPAIKRNLQTIAALLQARHYCHHIHYCFLYGLEPNLDEGLQQLSEADAEHRVIVPFLLFTGVLLTQLQQRVARENAAKRWGDAMYQLCEPLSQQPSMSALVSKRVHELLALPSIKQPVVLSKEAR